MGDRIGEGNYITAFRRAQAVSVQSVKSLKRSKFKIIWINILDYCTMIIGSHMNVLAVDQEAAKS